MTPENEAMEPSITASLLAGVMESAMDAIVTVNQRYEIVLFNRAAEIMFGLPRQAAMREPLDMLIPLRFRHGHAHSLAKFAATGASVRNLASSSVMTHGLRANGEEFPIDVSISRLETPDGRLLTAIVRDITDRQAAQAQLQLLEASIAHLSDMVLITEAHAVDEPGPRIVFANAAFERFTGYRAQEVLGKSPRLLHGPLTQRAELDRIRAALAACQPVRAELINYTRGGAAYWVELDIVPLADASGAVTHFVSVQRDVTARRQAAQALLDSEQRYAALFASAPVPMWVLDPASSRFLKVNQAAVEDYGYSEAEFMSLTLADIQADRAPMGERQDGADPARKRLGRFSHRRRDGSLFFVDAVARPIPHGGQPASFMVALDTTAQVRAEAEVRDQLFTLQRAADAAQAIAGHLTLDSVVQELVEQARGVIGAHQSAVSLATEGDWTQALQVLSLSATYLPGQDRLPLRQGSAIYRRGGNWTRPVRLTQAEVQAHAGWRQVGSAEGRDRMMRGWLAVPLTGRDGRHIGLLQLSSKYEGDFTQHDEYILTEMAQLACIAVENASLLEQVGQLNAGLEKKVAERTAALARQEALFRALAEQAPQVIWTTDDRGEVTYLNHAWCALMGGQRQDWIGWRWLSVLHPEDLPDLIKNWEQARASQAPFSGVRRWLCPNGSVHTMAYRASPVVDAQGCVSFWVGIDADVTEFKLVEAALRRSNEELEAFSYSVSHDLRAPLSTIDGFSVLLARQLAGSGNDKAAHYLARVQQGVTQMGRLIEDLLSLARLARTCLRYTQVDLSAMAQAILDEWQLRQPARQVAVHIEAGLTAHADEALLRVVLENLLGNAWKFSVQQAQAAISVGQQPDAAGQPVFFVRDNGAGFDMAYAERLFLPFERLHTVEEFPGTGIGLATVSRIIGHHGGRLWADAAPGLGATFFFTLPRQALTG